MRENYIITLFIAIFVLAGCASSKEVATAPATPPTSAGMPAENDPTAQEPVVEKDAEDEKLDHWMHLNGDDGTYVGIGTKRAYETVLDGKVPLKKVVVAVIDSGVDIEHEDIAVWTNEDEIDGNGIDDDKNGYIDDVNGWNFIGGSDGENVYYDTFEVTREYARLKPVFEGVDVDALSEEERKQHTYFLKTKEEFEAEVEEMTSIFNNINQAVGMFDAANSIMGDFLGKSDYMIEEVKKVSSPKEEVQQAQSIILYFDDIGLDQEQLLEERETFVGYLEKGLNPEFDPRDIVGDDYSNDEETYYGNNNVIGPDSFHGTHVSGIIGAIRGNDKGMDGVANSVEIMVVRAVPKGDERDKDIANAIRYAVDNGADIINMSFGKGLSPQKSVVDAAVKYAETHNVLMIHAAGNDGVNNDSTLHFPTRDLFDSEKKVSTWIEVGASSWEGPEKLAAGFSNFGKTNVDVFAPGVDIYSTAPGNKYRRSDGTSMASPVVAGLAALIMSYYPQFSAAEIKEVLLESASPYGDQVVTKPGTEATMVPFGMLSKTGGIVNAYGALLLAEKKAKGMGVQ